MGASELLPADKRGTMIVLSLFLHSFLFLYGEILKHQRTENKQKAFSSAFAKKVRVASK
jgi:hypothetical protein